MTVHLPNYVNPIAYFRKLFSFFIRVVLSAGIPLRITSNVGNYSIRFMVHTFLEYHLRAKQGYKREPITVSWILDMIDKDDVVYDIGANVGTYSLLIGLKMTSGSGRVFAFEPEAANFLSLNENIKLNKLGKRVIGYPIAFSDSSRSTHLFLSSNVRGSACHAIDAPESEGKQYVAEHTQGIYVLAVDEFFDKSDAPAPNHIKIDVDGAELGIVVGMKKMLQNHSLKTIMIEITEEKGGEEVQNIIAANGFKEAERQRWENKRVSNVLYIKENLVKDRN